MNHFNPILNKYNTVKKKLKAKVTEQKELNVKKEKTSILNPIQHITFQEEKFRPEPEQYTELLDTRIQIRPDFRDKLIEQRKSTFDKYYDYHIKGNRKCDEISLLGLRKDHMI